MIVFLGGNSKSQLFFSKQNGSSTTKYGTLVDGSFSLFHQTNNEIVKDNIVICFYQIKLVITKTIKSNIILEKKMSIFFYG